jgi:hypothetical protein
MELTDFLSQLDANMMRDSIGFAAFLTQMRGPQLAAEDIYGSVKENVDEEEGGDVANPEPSSSGRGGDSELPDLGGAAVDAQPQPIQAQAGTNGAAGPAPGQAAGGGGQPSASGQKEPAKILR